MSDTLDILIRARAEVEKGWCRSDAVSHEGNVCIRGAVGVAMGYLSRAEPCILPDYGYTPAERRLQATENISGLAAFNDRSTKADVIALFDKTIAAEAVKASPDPAHVHAVA